MINISQDDLSELMTKTVTDTTKLAIAAYLEGYANLIANATVTTSSPQAKQIANTILQQIAAEFRQSAIAIRK